MKVNITSFRTKIDKVIERSKKVEQKMNELPSLDITKDIDDSIQVKGKVKRLKRE